MLCLDTTLWSLDGQTPGAIGYQQDLLSTPGIPFFVPLDCAKEEARGYGI